MPPRAVAQWLCPSCRTLRSRPAAMHTRNMGLQNSDRTQRRFRWHIAAAGDQAKPFEGFYADLLSSPIYTTHPAAGKRSADASTTTQTSPQTPTTTSSSEPLAKTAKEATLERARIVFGSRLAGPAERRDALLRNSQLIGGVLVPPRPTEPDNCCMSGCVNCVWDVYRDELEEWAAKSAEARARLQAQRAAGEGTGSMVAVEGTPGHVATSMDDDGGGSEANWSSALAPGVGTVADLLKDVPVGIREFMKTEKMLKQKHLREGTTA